MGPVAPNPATAGLGKQWLADGRPPEGGTSSRTNIASAYVQLVERGTGRDLGTHLVSQFLNDQDRIFRRWAYTGIAPHAVQADRP